MNPCTQDSTRTQEESLWISVLLRACRDVDMLFRIWQSNKDILTNPIFRHDICDLRRWFHSKNTEPGSALFCLDVLGGVHQDYMIKKMEEAYFIEMLGEYRRDTKTSTRKTDSREYYTVKQKDNEQRVFQPTAKKHNETTFLGSSSGSYTILSKESVGKVWYLASYKVECKCGITTIKSYHSIYNTRIKHGENCPHERNVNRYKKKEPLVKGNIVSGFFEVISCEKETDKSATDVYAGRCSCGKEETIPLRRIRLWKTRYGGCPHKVGGTHPE